VAVGGGSLEDAQLISVIDDETFSFFVGYDKKGNLKGNFYAKRVIADRGQVAVKSTEITDLQFGTENGSSWVMMTGLADFMPAWSIGHNPGHRFTLIAWDNDSAGNGPDTIWFQVQRPYPDPYVRPAISLLDYTEVDGGNILILPHAME
jgi:hypothetical protein